MIEYGLLQRIILVFSISLKVSLGISSSVTDSLVINEFCASNSSIISDESGEYDDWIEIYNNSDQDIDLSGFYLTDNLSDLTKWKIPAGTTILKHNYLLFWADNSPSGTTLHTNFKLSSSGEEIALVAKNGITILDQITFGSQDNNLSYGRYPNGYGAWGVMHSPTPKATNNETFAGVVPDLNFSHKRGLYESAIQLSITSPDSEAKIYYTTDRSKPGTYVKNSDHLLGNSDIDGSSSTVDAWNGIMIINTYDTYINESDSIQELRITNFNFYAGQLADPVTPFVVKVNGGSNFTTLAVGKTRLNSEYEAGINNFDFSDGDKIISLNPGDAVAAGFLDANANGSGGTGGAVIPFDIVVGHTIFLTGSVSGTNAGSVSEGQPVTLGLNSGNYDREYKFQIETTFKNGSPGGADSTFSGKLYTGPITINKTTGVRAIAVKPNWKSSRSESHSYIFPEEIKNESYMWNTVTNDATWGPKVKPALYDLPSISVLTPDLLGDSEKEASIEIIYPDGSEGFQINSGVEVSGSGSLAYPKKSIRLSFKGKYGDSKMNYDLYEGDATKEFDQLILRSGAHDAVFWEESTKSIYIRNQWAFDRQREMGHPASHGKFVHLYVNNEYRGQYNIIERPNASFMASYFGGSKDDYSSINKGNVIDGSIAGWTALKASTSSYNNMQSYFDLVSYADYMLLMFYCGNDWDWRPKQNWMVSGGNSTPMNFQFFAWDNDMVLRRDVNTSVLDKGGPDNIWASVAQHDAFKLIFADRANQFLIEKNSMLSPNKVTEQLNALANKIDLSIIAETARWGSWNNVNYTHDSWKNTVNEVISDIVYYRSDIVIEQLDNAGLLPNIDAPVLFINGFEPENDTILPNSNMTLKAGINTIYYTLDGSDPYNIINQTISTSAVKYTEGLTINTTTPVKARATNGTTWSALLNKLLVIEGSSKVEFAENNQNSSIQLSDAYPNPFRGQTQLSFYLPESEQVSIAVYNSLGQIIKVLTDNYYPEGNHTISWNGTDENGLTVSSGVYFTIMQTEQNKLSTKVIFIK